MRRLPPTDPDEYRMSLGDHLEELRSRLIRAVFGFFLAFVVCLIFVKGHVLPFFCKPLLDTLKDYDLNPQLFSTDMGDTFTLYLRVSAIAACVIAGPWMLYQLWQFVASGLYPNERRTVTKFIPLSILLLIVGVTFAFFVVLPWTIQFFLMFMDGMKLPSSFEPIATTQSTTIFKIPMLAGDPVSPEDGQMWINVLQNRVKLALHGEIRTMQFGPENLVAPIFTIPGYISLVLMMLLLFGVSFQLPLVILALARIGILDVTELKAMRKVVYFVLVIVAAVITPGDVFTATIALTVPLILLYELGIWLARSRS